MNETGRLTASCHVGGHESHRKEGHVIGSNTHIIFFFPAPPRVCYSPSSPVQILEEPAYFYPDLQLYSGRHEASTLTVEASGGLRGKGGKSSCCRCVESSEDQTFSFLALLQ